MIQVWRVTTIAITRRLGDVEISADDGLVKVHEHDIYLPLVIPELRQAEVNYELASHFANLLGTENTDCHLLTLLINAPVGQLSNILQRHNILPPGGMVDGADIGSEGEADCEDVTSTGDARDAREGWNGNDVTPGLDMSAMAIPVTVASTTVVDKGAPTLPTAARSPKVLEGPIHLHRSRTRDISQMANSFNILDCIVASSSTQSREVADTTGFGATTIPGSGTNTGGPPGTAVVIFSPMVEKEPNNPSRSNSFQSILFMDAYKKWSLDELRLADYGQGRKPDSLGGLGAFGGFGLGGTSGIRGNPSGAGFGASTGTGMDVGTQPTRVDSGATTAATTGGSTGISALSFPIRTREISRVLNADNPEQETRRITRGNSDSSQSHFSRLPTTVTASRSTPQSATPGSGDSEQLLPAAESRYREIGFHGELFVSTPFVDHLLFYSK